MSKPTVSIQYRIFIPLLFLLMQSSVSGYDKFDAVGDTVHMIPALTPEAQAELYNTGKTGRFYFAGENRSLYLPETPLSGPVQAELSELDPNIGFEALYLLEAPGLRENNASQQLEIYNLTRRLHSLQGIEYFSASRGRMRTFFKKFYRISGPEETAPVPDSFVNAIPEEDILYAFQEDLTFGENISRLHYRYRAPYMGLSIQNREKMRYALIPLIQEEGMQMHLIIIMFRDHILFYGNCAVSTLDFLGLVKKKKESFSNRIEAMYRWFRREFGTLILTEN